MNVAGVLGTLTVTSVTDTVQISAGEFQSSEFKGSNANDHIVIGNATLTINGAAIHGTFDNLSIDALAGDDLFTINGTSVAATLLGSGGNDTFLFSSSAASAT